MRCLVRNFHRDQDPSDLSHVGVDRDAVYRRRVRDRLTVLGGHLDPCTGRLLGVEGRLLDRVAAAGAAGQVGKNTP